jgi:anaerobic magnesium-protoporphyrin IX monomethyl ester cyclase
MKVCLVSSGPNHDLDDKERNKSITAFPPLGLLYLSAILEEKGLEVSVLDQAGQGFTLDQTVNWVLEQNPDVLGFSTLTTSGISAAQTSDNVKQKNPNILTVLGNHYATFNSERILKRYPSVDVVVRGEGERTFSQLVDSVGKNGDLSAVKGITYRKGNTVVSNEDQALIKDLDVLPFPDRKLIDVEYHCMISGANAAPKKFTSVLSSRGCAYHCRFCNCGGIARNSWRSRSAENTIKELCELSGDGYKQVLFVDDSFTLNPKRTLEICREIRKEKLDLQWICEGRVDHCSRELFQEMTKAGLKVLYFGIENANQRILDYYHKTITPQKSETAVKTARRAGVDVIVGSFIMGAPDETRAEIQNTINFAKRLPIDIPQFSVLAAYPGNDIWTEMQTKGYLNGDDYWETGVAVSQVSPTAVPVDEIKKMVHQAFFDFVKRPKYLLREFARTVKSPYRRNIILSNMKHISEIKEATSKVA